MAHLACPCGNSLSNSCDGNETEYYFVEYGVIEAHQDDFAFFELEYNDLSTEIWKCDVCDRMMFFDGPSARVSRYMRRIDAESLGKDESPASTRAESVSATFCSTKWIASSTASTNRAESRTMKSSATPASRTEDRCSLVA